VLNILVMNKHESTNISIRYVHVYIQQKLQRNALIFFTCIMRETWFRNLAYVHVFYAGNLYVHMAFTLRR
jgi:hypothetical protein